MATDPLSLFFIGCFLFGLLFLLVTIMLGSLGGHTHTGHIGHVGHVGHIGPTQAAPTQAGSHAVGAHAVHTHSTPAQAHTGHTAQGNQVDGSSWLSYVNPTSIVFFLIGFGFFGYVLHNTAHLLLSITLILAAVSGLVIAALLLLLFSRIFSNIEGETEQDVADRTGLLGTVSIPIQENGMGEILYTSPAGLRKSIPARSINGQRLERGQEVVVVNYAQGIAEVDTWDHFINEQTGENEEHEAYKEYNEGYEAYAGNREQAAPQAIPQAPKSDPDELARLRALLEDSGTDNTDMGLVIRNEMQKE
jgi:membrane protein implicated in regulation of membrane protease activity